MKRVLAVVLVLLLPASLLAGPGGGVGGSGGSVVNPGTGTGGSTDNFLTNVNFGGTSGGKTGQTVYIPAQVLPDETDPVALRRTSRIEDELAVQALSSIAYRNATENPYRWYRYSVGNAFEFDVTNDLSQMEFNASGDYWLRKGGVLPNRIYLMNDNAASTDLADGGSDGQAGTLPSNSATMATNGVFGGALSFNAQTATIPAFTFGDNWTFSVWIYGTWSAVNPLMGIFSSDTQVYPGFTVYATPSTINIGGSASGSGWDLIDPAVVNFSVPDDQWTMVSVVHTGATFTVYTGTTVVVVYTNEAAFTSTVVDAVCKIGEVQGQYALTGLMDNLLISRQAAGSYEIASFYNGMVYIPSTNYSLVTSKIWTVGNSVSEGKVLFLVGSGYPTNNYINTNLTASISADGGATWTNARLSYAGAFKAGVSMWEGTNRYAVSGTNIAWKVEATNAPFRLYGAADWGVE